MLCWQAAFLFEWVTTGRPFVFFFWAPNLVFCVLLLAFRRQYWLVGFPGAYFSGLLFEMPLLCAMDDQNETQFLFAYDTGTECVFRGST